MKKIILILNHVTAGMGSDEQAQLPPGGKNSSRTGRNISAIV